MSKIELTAPTQIGSLRDAALVPQATIRTPSSLAHSTMSATTTVTLGDRTFTLDKTKAEAAFAAKRVINGRETMFFNILPLKYQWAYDLYKTMKNNHWEPEDITDAEGCRAVALR